MQAFKTIFELFMHGFELIMVLKYSSASLVRGFWDEEFFAKKPRTTEVPRTKEVHLFWACITPTCIPFMR